MIDEPHNIESFTDIMKSFLQAMERENIINKGSKNKQFSSIVSMLETVKKALSIYEETFKGSYKTLANQLDMDELFDYKLMMLSGSRVSDEEMYQALVEMTDFDNTIYNSYFDIKVTSFTKCQIIGKYAKLTIYPLVSSFCEAVTSQENYSLNSSLL